ncbi:MAG TPA: efflux RND transporter permease subunit [Virgibacillus sp.]|nr:efflux RND transporter permease subunit [Virgibacillus sp.]HLR68689.1 efflux RND transporter permease subunit [Virgibacillus sp.]
MKLVSLSVRRPVGVIMIVLAIIALGTVSVRNLAVDLFPKIDLPIAVVATSYDDAAPEEVENLVSDPIENAISSVEGIEDIQVQSSADSSLVVMMFKNGTDLDQALLDVRERVDQTEDMLPDRAESPNIMRFSPDELPVMWVGLTGEDTGALSDLAEDEVVPYFERQEGVASVSAEGTQEREIQLTLDEAALEQNGVTSQEVMEAISNANESASVGNIEKGSQDLQVRVTGEFESVEEVRQTVIQSESEATVHVEDIAEVEDTVKADDSSTLVNGESSVVLPIMKKSDANTVDVANNIQQSIDKMNDELPEEAGVEVVIDTSEFIQDSIDSVIKNILIGGAISLLVLLLFLKSIRATIVIGLSIPIAIISTFALMYFTGNTLNVLTLGGLALGIGMMVDSSIVILENIYSYRQRGHSLFESATKGAAELTPAVIASTTTTLVVFLPIVYVEGIASDLFTPLALTVSFSLIASLVVAVTVVPMLSSKLLAQVMEKGHRYWFDRLLEKLNNGYSRALKKVLKFRKTSTLVTILLIIGSIVVTPIVGAEFIPAGDQGQMEISVETREGSTIEHTEDIVDEVNDVLNEYDTILDVSFVDIGGDDIEQGGDVSESNEANFTLQLVPTSERDISTADFVQEVNSELQEIPGAEITVSEMEEGVGMGDPINIELSGPEHEVLNELADHTVEEIKDVEGVYNPESGSEEGVPQVNVDIDHDKAASYGLTADAIQQQIENRFIGQVVTEYHEAGQEIDVNLQYPDDTKETISDLEDMKIEAPSGSTVTLTDVGSIEEEIGPVTLIRQNQEAHLSVTSEIADRDLGSVVQDVQTKLDNMEFPEGYDYSMGGEAEDMEDSFIDLTLALVFSIFLVYAVMAIQFENFLFPFIIMFSIPATVVGIVLGFLVTGLSFSIPAFIGVIMLAGIVVNNSIVLVDYINILRRRGMERYEAIIEAGRSRLRPILMTTLTTVLAMIPLGLALGEGAEMQQPLAVTIIFGLSVSTIFTLLLIPIIYTFFDDLTKKILRRKTNVKEENIKE